MTAREKETRFFQTLFGTFSGAKIGKHGVRLLPQQFQTLPELTHGPLEYVLSQDDNYVSQQVTQVMKDSDHRSVFTDLEFILLTWWMEWQERQFSFSMHAHRSGE